MSVSPAGRFFCVRLTRIYFAMLTLAFAQVAWSVVFQWSEVTNGDDGLLGIWPAPWASSGLVYYYVALAVAAGGIVAIRHVVFAPFGYGLRATRDSLLRSAAIGIACAVESLHVVEEFLFGVSPSDAINLAGGLTENAYKSGVNISRNGQVYEIDLKALYDHGGGIIHDGNHEPVVPDEGAVRAPLGFLDSCHGDVPAIPVFR